MLHAFLQAYFLANISYLLRGQYQMVRQHCDYELPRKAYVWRELDNALRAPLPGW
jgi:hypothetical protein